jgi:hypothetical protein
MIKQRIKNWLLKHLFNAVVSTDFIVSVKGKLFINGKALNQRQVELVAKQAYECKKSDHVVTLMLNELSHLAHEKIYYKEDREFGKALLYNVNMIHNKLNALSSLHKNN